MAAGCARTTPGSLPGAAGVLAIANPERMDVEIRIVEQDSVRSLERAGSGEFMERTLPSGVYEVRAGRDGSSCAVPAPLLASLIPGSRLDVRVVHPPAADQDWC